MTKITLNAPPYEVVYNEEEIKSAISYARILRNMVATVPAKELELINAFSSDEYREIECEPEDADLDSDVWDSLSVRLE